MQGWGWTVGYPPEQVRVPFDSQTCDQRPWPLPTALDLLSTPCLPRGTEALPEDWALGGPSITRVSDLPAFPGRADALCPSLIIIS